MSEYLVTINELKSIANSIRNKTNTSNQLTFPNEFISGINNIPDIEIYSYINGNLSEIYNSEITSLTDYIFAYHFNLTTASFPSCTSIGSYAFFNCTSLTTVSFPSCTSIEGYAFGNCYNLTSLNLTGISQIPSLPYSTAFSSTPIGGYTTSTGGVYGSIYVPSSLYDAFTSATNWTYFSSRIVGV